MKLESPRPKEIRSSTDFVIHVERTLGFVLPDDKPAWKARSVEAGKLNRKRATNQRLYSMANLLLTVEWLRQRKKPVKSPVAVCWFVEDALKNARSEADVDVVDLRVEQAIAEAAAIGRADWVSRLSRAQGAGREEVVAEWESRYEHDHPDG